MIVCDKLMEMIQAHEMHAVRVEVDPVFGDVIFQLPDRSGMSVPRPVWVEYCRRMRPSIDGANAPKFY